MPGDELLRAIEAGGKLEERIAELEAENAKFREQLVAKPAAVPQSEAEMRTEFEVCWTGMNGGSPFVCDRSSLNGEYVDRPTAAGWLAWQECHRRFAAEREKVRQAVEAWEILRKRRWTLTWDSDPNPKYHGWEVSDSESGGWIVDAIGDPVAAVLQAVQASGG